MQFAQRLKEIRIEKGYNQTEIAKIINKTQKGYSHLETGKSRFTLDDVKKLCEFYNISADYILGLTDEKRPLK